MSLFNRSVLRGRPWRNVLLYAGLIALGIAGQLLAGGSAFAHEGHNHDGPPPLNLPVAPRVTAVTPDYELVGVVSGEQRLTIFLHHFATNEPVEKAGLAVSFGDDERQATAVEDGVFEVSAPWISASNPVDMIFLLTVPDGQDLLTGRLELTPSVEDATEQTSTPQLKPIFLVGVGGLMAGVLLTLLVSGSFSRRRRSHEVPPQPAAEPAEATADWKVQPLKRAPVAVLIAVVCAMLSLPHEAEAKDKLPSVPATMATDAPQRMPDGSVFVPKPTQHLLSVRTSVTSESQAPRTVQLLGTVIADPNSFGRVQPARPGRIEAPESGLAYVGKRVAKGELLGYLIPYVEAADRTNIESQLAETEARIVKLETILARYNSRPGVVPVVKVDEVEGELDALRRKRAELKPSLVAREEIRAPITGTISLASVVPGQIVDPREILFEIVDPKRLWLEAIAHDASVTDNLSKAYGVTTTGKSLELEFVGQGLSLKQQATPLTFRISEPSPDLGIGKPVTVILQSTVQLNGFVLPASTVVRGPSGLPIVWVKREPERFDPQVVRFEPLDGQRVVVLAGLKPEQRVVTDGATLLNQIR